MRGPVRQRLCSPVCAQHGEQEFEGVVEAPGCAAEGSVHWCRTCRRLCSCSFWAGPSRLTPAGCTRRSCAAAGLVLKAGCALPASRPFMLVCLPAASQGTGVCCCEPQLTNRLQAHTHLHPLLQLVPVELCREKGKQPARWPMATAATISGVFGCRNPGGGSVECKSS